MGNKGSNIRTESMTNFDTNKKKLEKRRSSGGGIYKKLNFMDPTRDLLSDSNDKIASEIQTITNTRRPAKKIVEKKVEEEVVEVPPPTKKPSINQQSQSKLKIPAPQFYNPFCRKKGAEKNICEEKDPIVIPTSSQSSKILVRGKLKQRYICPPEESFIEEDDISICENECSESCSSINNDASYCYYFKMSPKSPTIAQQQPHQHVDNTKNDTKKQNGIKNEKRKSSGGENRGENSKEKGEIWEIFDQNFPCVPCDPCELPKTKIPCRQQKGRPKTKQPSICTEPIEIYRKKTCKSPPKNCHPCPKPCTPKKCDEIEHPKRCSIEKNTHQPKKCSIEHPQPKKCSIEHPQPRKCSIEHPQPRKCSIEHPQPKRCSIEKSPQPRKCSMEQEKCELKNTEPRKKSVEVPKIRPASLEHIPPKKVEEKKIRTADESVSAHLKIDCEPLPKVPVGNNFTQTIPPPVMTQTSQANLTEIPTKNNHKTQTEVPVLAEAQTSQFEFSNVNEVKAEMTSTADMSFNFSVGTATNSEPRIIKETQTIFVEPPKVKVPSKVASTGTDESSFKKEKKKRKGSRGKSKTTMIVKTHTRRRSVRSESSCGGGTGEGHSFSSSTGSSSRSTQDKNKASAKTKHKKSHKSEEGSESRSKSTNTKSTNSKTQESQNEEESEEERKKKKKKKERVVEEEEEEEEEEESEYEHEKKRKRKKDHHHNNNNDNNLNSQFFYCPPRSNAFQVPLIKLRDDERRNQRFSAHMHDKNHVKLDDDERHVNFGFTPKHNHATELTFQVEPRKTPLWKTMMRMGFVPLINCGVPPVCMSNFQPPSGLKHVPHQCCESESSTDESDSNSDESESETEDEN